ncbi:MAG: hypothetical protein LBJ94_01020 [Puniceicoccales bacterium]|jgi:hypothetical protein|nr:hypothetical protein [Puniceicoccales bacterium]
MRRTISCYNDLAAKQSEWLEGADEISRKFDDAHERLKSNRNLGSSLMSFIEKVAAESGCKFELSDERRYGVNEITIASVNAALRSVSMAEFVHFSEAITCDGTRMGDVHFTAAKDGNLNVKCLIEAVFLGERWVR